MPLQRALAPPRAKARFRRGPTGASSTQASLLRPRGGPETPRASPPRVSSAYRLVFAVLLVPGICGSILTVHQRGVPPWRAWIVLEHSDDQFRYLLGRFDPENGTFRALSDGVRTGATLSHAVGDGALREAVASPAGAAAAGTRGDASRGIGWAAGALLERARSGTGVALGVAMADADDNPDVTIVPGVPGDDTGLAGISVLDPDMIAPVNALHYYYDMIKYLESQGYVDGQTLFGFPFDFRQSNRAHCTLVSARTRSRRRCCTT